MHTVTQATDAANNQVSYNKTYSTIMTTRKQCRYVKNAMQCKKYSVRKYCLYCSNDLSQWKMTAHPGYPQLTFYPPWDGKMRISFRAKKNNNKKHLNKVGPIRHCKPPHAALPFTRCRYCRDARRLRIDVHNNDDNNAWQRGPLWPHRMGPINGNGGWGWLLPIIGGPTAQVG